MPYYGLFSKSNVYVFIFLLTLYFLLPYYHIAQISDTFLAVINLFVNYIVL